MQQTQSLDIQMVSNEEIDAQIAAENKEEAMHLAKQTADLREAMGDLNAMVYKGGEKIRTIDEQVAAHAATVRAAFEQTIGKLPNFSQGDV